MALRCRECGALSALEDAYVHERSPFGRRRSYCPRCARGRRERAGHRVLRQLVFLPLAGAGLLLLARVLGFGTFSGWAVINAWLFLVFGYLAVIPHEIGHALMARAVGFRVFSISCGVGPLLFDRLLGGVRLSVRAFPIDGGTVVTPSGTQGYRWKQALVIAAGPAVNAICLAAALALGPDLRVGRMLDGPALGLVFVAANAFAVMINLLPIRVSTVHGLLPNDGLALLQTPRLDAAAVEEALTVRYILEAQSCGDEGRLRDAVSWIERGLQRQPYAAALHLAMGSTLALLGQYDEARRRFVHVTQLPGLTPVAQATAWNNIAWADVLMARREGLEEADRLSQQALETVGWTPAFKGTRGAVLVAMGRTEEGLALLFEALHEDADEPLHPMARATYTAAVALGLLAQGRRHEAARQLDAARRCFPSCPLLQHVEAALADAAAAVKPPASA